MRRVPIGVFFGGKGEGENGEGVGVLAGPGLGSHSGSGRVLSGAVLALVSVSKYPTVGTLHILVHEPIHSFHFYQT